MLAPSPASTLNQISHHRGIPIPIQLKTIPL
jgi:hypothetical protein